MLLFWLRRILRQQVQQLNVEYKLKKVEIYTTKWCGFCLRAKSLLSKKNIAYTEFKVDGDPTLRSHMMQRANGGRTVPQIFIGDEHVGGSDELHALERAGKLDAMLAG